MLRIGIKALAAVAVLSLLAAQNAQAGWWHRHHGSYGSYGSYGSWGSSGGSWGSSGGRWGSSGGYVAYYGSSGGSWGSSGGSWGSSGGSSGGYRVNPAPEAAPATPTTPSAPGAEPVPPTPGPTSEAYHPTYGPLRTSALLSVKVPAEANVFINDRPTTSTGSEREFVSRDLQVGTRYNYNVRAEFTRDGKAVNESRSVRLAAGQSASIDFTQPAAPTASAEARTTLIVRLPEDAKLFLAGHEMKATGSVREFSTGKLPAGSEWNTYAIRAVVERDGKPEVREETVSLKAGESREVTISFDSAQVADKVADVSAR